MKKIKNIGNSMLHRPWDFFRGTAFILLVMAANTAADLLKTQNQPEA